MAQEAVAESRAVGRAFDEPRNVGDDEAAFASVRTTPRLGASVVNG